jgi:hypothetical protein
MATKLEQQLARSDDLIAAFVALRIPAASTS